SPGGRPARTAPDFFSRKEIGERKEGEGNFSFPSPLPSKRAAFYGAAPIARVQRFPDRQKARNWPRHALEIPPQKNESRDAFWGSPEGGIPPLGFLSHRFLSQR